MSEFSKEVIEATTYAVGCSKEQAIIILKETERQKEIVIQRFVNSLKNEIADNMTFIQNRDTEFIAFYSGEELTQTINKLVRQAEEVGRK